MMNQLYNLFSKTRFWVVLGGLSFFLVLIYISDKYVGYQGWLQYSGDDADLVVIDSALGWDIFLRAWPIVVISTPITGVFIFSITAWIIGITIEIDTNHIENGITRLNAFDEKLLDSVNKRLKDITVLSDHYIQIEASREQDVYEAEFNARRLNNENKSLKERLSKQIDLAKAQEEHIKILSDKIDSLKKTAGGNLSDYLKSIDEIKVIESNKSELMSRLSKSSAENKSLKNQVSDLDSRLRNALSKLERLKTKQKGSEF
ncbi:MAG: hypothetical protein KGZ88_20360 [Methylomicrobium sp.]|nr:hypothetical protein [Methylomicrobium sp.]